MEAYVERYTKNTFYSFKSIYKYKGKDNFTIVGPPMINVKIGKALQSRLPIYFITLKKRNSKPYSVDT